MKDRLERHRAKLTPREDERVWNALRRALPAGERSTRRRMLPMTLVSALGAVAVVFAVLKSGHRPEEVTITRADEPRRSESTAAKAEKSAPAAPSENQVRIATPNAGGDKTDATANEGAGMLTEQGAKNAHDAVLKDTKRFEAEQGEAGQSEAVDREIVLTKPPTKEGDDTVWLDAASSTDAASPSGVASNATSAKPQLERSRVDKIAEEIAKRAGVTKRGDEPHSRGGRSGEVAVNVPSLSATSSGRDEPTPSDATGTVTSPVLVEGKRRPPINLQDTHLEIGVAAAESRAKQEGSKEAAAPGSMERFAKARPHVPAPNDMFFEAHGINPFVETRDDALATFAVDVDDASYVLARSYLDHGTLPPPEAIRVEEFINALPHDYEPPQGDILAAEGARHADEGTFAIHLDAAPSPFGEGLTLLRVGLKGREVAGYERKPMNLVFVIDTSGSMREGNRIEVVKAGLIDLLYRLNEDDRVGLVTYATAARVLAPLTSVRERIALEEAVGSLAPEGSTNVAEGLRLGYALLDRAYDAERTNRVVLCSDGVANTGVTEAEDMLRLIKENTGRGIDLTAVGVGMGNYNDALLERLADEGDGNYFYVDDTSEAKRVLADRFIGTLETIARDVKIQVEFDPDTVERYRLLGYENRDVADRDFRNDAVDAGEVGAGHEVTALFEVALRREPDEVAARADAGSPEEPGVRRSEEDERKGPTGAGRIATVRVRSESPDDGTVREDTRSFYTSEMTRRFERTHPSFQLDAAAAELAEILRHSYWAKDGSLEAVEGLSRRVEEATHGRPATAAELTRMAAEAKRLWPSDAPPRWRPRGDE